jgi:hypothetical protein
MPGFEVGFALQWLPIEVLDTSRRAAGTGPWSCGREPALAVSLHPGDSPWRKKGKGRERAAGRGQVPAGERERRAGLTPPALLRFL